MKGSMYDKYCLGNSIPKNVTQWVDRGFQRIANKAINDVYRNRKGNTDDKLMIVSSGISNLFIA